MVRMCVHFFVLIAIAKKEASFLFVSICLRYLYFNSVFLFSYVSYVGFCLSENFYLLVGKFNPFIFVITMFRHNPYSFSLSFIYSCTIFYCLPFNFIESIGFLYVIFFPSNVL